MQQTNKGLSTSLGYTKLVQQKIPTENSNTKHLARPGRVGGCGISIRYRVSNPIQSMFHRKYPGILKLEIITCIENVNLNNYKHYIFRGNLKSWNKEFKRSVNITHDLDVNIGGEVIHLFCSVECMRIICKCRCMSIGIALTD